MANPSFSFSSRRLGPRVQWLIVAGFALAAVGLFGAAALLNVMLGGSAETAPPPSPPGTFRPTEAQWASLKIEPVGTFKFHAEVLTDGKIASDDDLVTPVYSPFSGLVTKLYAKAGDGVAKGQRLMDIAASEMAQAQSDLIAAVQQLHLASLSEARQHALYEAKGGALKDWEQAKSDLETARANERAVRNRLRILGNSDTEIDALGQKPAANAVSPVTAPIAGVVTARQVGLGQYVGSAAAGASSPVFTIADTSRVWLLANIPEDAAAAMHVGLHAEARILAIPGRVFNAKITYVGAAIDPNTKRLPVRAEIDNPDGALKAEMFASFRILTGDDTEAPGIPEEAVVYEGRTARVWVRGQDGSVELRQVETGRTQNGEVEVLSGLKAGESIVTSGSLFIDRAAENR
jgi:cobalt-zinc-cadmium efflux system membrane fusion protein